MSRHKLLVILILASLAVTAAALPAGAQARVSIKGPGYRTYVPSGWKIKHRKTKIGWRRVDASPHGRTNDSVSVTIGAISARKLEKAMKRKLPASAVEIAGLLAPVPPSAVNVQVTAQPQATTLGGALAGVVAFHYQLGGQGVSASATAVRRGNRIYLVDVSGDDSQALFGQSAVGMVGKSWRWT